MERLAWLVVLAVTAVGCGGGLPADSEATTITSNASAPSTGTVIETTHANSTSSLTLATTQDSLITTTTIITNTETTTTSSPSSSDYNPALQSLVDLAIADLAARLNADPADISVVSAEAVVWPNGALGCPQTGMVYTQVQVEGAKIVLSHSGVAYPYHSGGSKAPFLCKKA